MKFEGILPALVTPLQADESIRIPVLHQLIDFLLHQGVDGFYVGGATGEGLALRTEQRMILAQEAVAAVHGEKPCIIQVAAMDFQDALLLAQHAEAIGAAAISATPPLFFQYDQDDVYQYYKALAAAVHIPLMVYYNPSAGFQVHAEFAARLFAIDNITAIKWTSSNFYEMLRLKDLTHGEMNILNGSDEMLLMGLSAGADGGIGTTYNFLSGLMQTIYQSFRSHQLQAAQQAQAQADRIIAALLQYPLIPATKAVLEQMGFDVGLATFPMKRYSADEKAAIFAALCQSGFQPPLETNHPA